MTNQKILLCDMGAFRMSRNRTMEFKHAVSTRASTDLSTARTNPSSVFPLVAATTAPASRSVTLLVLSFLHSLHTIFMQIFPIS